MKKLIYIVACLAASTSNALMPDSYKDLSDEEKGLAIAKEASRRDDGFMSNQFDMKMLIKNSNGTESERQLRVKNLEVENDGNKTLIIFDSPQDQRGTKVLSFSHKLEPDDQMIYLPALNRVKRIASNNRSGPFAGSEFSYEDITSPEVEKYTYKYLKTEDCASGSCYVIELKPVNDTSGYKRQVVWYDANDYYVLKTDYYDKRDSLLKTLVYTGYKKYADSFWRADKASMENLQTGKSTLLIATDWQFKVDVSSEDFSSNGLQRVR
ncbi:MAG: outer membrane lipoprotein-sorting protein [Pseudomonadota bacterium]